MIWVKNNIGTVIVASVLIAVVALIVIKLIADKKRGSSLCGCNCAHCALNCKCNKNN